jgi:hypothetical protein
VTVSSIMRGDVAPAGIAHQANFPGARRENV